MTFFDFRSKHLNTDLMILRFPTFVFCIRLLSDAVNGINGTIITYGQVCSRDLFPSLEMLSMSFLSWLILIVSCYYTLQTGAGKTYSMEVTYLFL